ncbi:Limulus clotting factor C [Araneus ventricosus]|uniref:Limulus clotting factor C n=2 Tax=Araneus ventricosus TaxID=182803 RepID=A0A4Y2U909_ARAVE|nr:Limulus clotting factor C [Araneus ventricosus]
MTFFLAVTLFGCFVDICYTRGVNLGLCDDTYFNCICGQTDFRVRLKVKQCSYSHRWKVRCKPCDDLKEEDVCPRYGRCLTCHANGGDNCATCPDGKYGTWCENGKGCFEFHVILKEWLQKFIVS